MAVSTEQSSAESRGPLRPPDSIQTDTDHEAHSPRPIGDVEFAINLSISPRPIYPVALAILLAFSCLTLAVAGSFSGLANHLRQTYPNRWGLDYSGPKIFRQYRNANEMLTWRAVSTMSCGIVPVCWFAATLVVGHRRRWGRSAVIVLVLVPFVALVFACAGGYGFGQFAAPNSPAIMNLVGQPY